MKKILSVLTAVAMVLSMGVTALAAEGSLGVIGGADGPTSVFVTMPVFDNSFVSMAAELPYPGQVNIWLDGKFMTFEDAVPAEIDGRTQAPYRAVLEAMGAEVSYDEGAIQARFEDGSVMDLAIGSKVMTYTKDGKTNTVNMDVAPYIDNASGRTFVPVRFIGETLGRKVTWNNELKTAYIIDWDRMEAAIDAQFSTFNEMMKTVAEADQTTGKNYKSDDDISLKIDYNNESATVGVKGSSLTDGVNSSGTYTLNIDLGGFAEGTQDEAALLAVLDGAQFEVISNTENGVYLRSALMTIFSSGVIPADGWLHITPDYLNMIAEEMGELSLDMESLMANAADMTMGKLIRLLCEDGRLAEEMGDLAPDQAASFFVSIYDGVFGNDSIKVTKSGSTVKYVMKADKSFLTDFMTEMGASQADLDEIAEFLTFDFNMSVTLRNNRVTDVTAKMNMAMTDDTDSFKMTMDLSGTDTKVKGTIGLSGTSDGESFGLTIGLSSVMTETREKPLDKPSDGDILTVEQLVNLLSGAVQTQAA